MERPTRRIVIVGGGTAGWICAGTISAAHRTDKPGGIDVVLVESPDTPTVGVGEGTWPTMRNTLRRMGISETEFFRQCDASFKQGARFCRWVTGENDDYYYHPLMLPQGFLQGNLVPHWQRSREANFSDMVCPQDAICDRALAPKQISTPEYAGVLNYAYHLDAGKFSDFVKSHCIDKLGVQHILAHVDAIVPADNGDIAALSLRDGGKIEGDLFIDCTGFRSKLLGGHYGVGFRSCRDTLFIDRALAVHLPYKDEREKISSQTISTAQSNGWIWDIALQSRRGVGHVWSSVHTDEEKAMEELEVYATQSGHDLGRLDVRKIAFDPGHREKFWHRNCVAVGLSAGFLEPLEASALVLVELSANMIAEQMPVTRDAMDIVARRFNTKFLYRWDRIIDFLKLHYVLNQRYGERFWDDNRDVQTVPASLNELLTLWQYQYPWHDDFDHKDEVFPAASYQYVLYGMGFQTMDSHLGTSSTAADFARHQFLEVARQKEKLLAAMPDHRALLNKIVQYGMQRI